MKVFVTGGTGFIGKRLITSLINNNYDVTMLSRRDDCITPDGVKVVKGDLISQSNSIKQYIRDCDVVCHCAGEIQNKAMMSSLHIDGTKRLLDAVLLEAESNNRKIHWIQLSSVGVYGPPAGSAKCNRIITENSALNPIGEYEKTKSQSDELVIKAAGTGFITYSIVRPSNVFSVDMSNHSLRSLAKLIDKRLFFFIGKPGAIATYIHVEDLVKLLLCCAVDERAKNEVFNISNDCLLEELVDGISESLNRKKIKIRIPEIIVRVLVTVAEIVFKLPLTKERINALVLRTKYPYTKLENRLDFVPMFSVPITIGEIASQIKIKR